MGELGRDSRRFGRQAADTPEQTSEERAENTRPWQAGLSVVSDAEALRAMEKIDELYERGLALNGERAA